jgi:hypothetical protein
MEINPASAPPVSYRIDRDDRLEWVNEGWLMFAEANGAPSLKLSRVRGRVIWDFIGDPTIAHLYRVLVQRLRGGAPPVRFHFRCDAPTVRRLAAMDITGDRDGAVHFEVTPVMERAQVPAPRIEVALPDEEPLVRVCAWCKRVELPADTWIEPEDAVSAFSLFDSPAFPGLTHGMCPRCYGVFNQQLDMREEEATRRLRRMPRESSGSAGSD